MSERKKPGRKPGVTMAEIEQRKHLVFEMMVKQAMRPVDIHDYIVANVALKTHEDPELRKRYNPKYDWDVTVRQIEAYYEDARQALRTVNLLDAHAEYRKAVIRNEDLYRRAVSKGDMSTARQLEKDRQALVQYNAFDHGQMTKSEGPAIEKATIELPGGAFLEL